MYRFAINRPITTLMWVAAFIVFGVMAFGRMPVALFPNVDFPIVTIQTALPGADPETVESKVTDKIEEIVSGIDGIDKLISSSFEGLSVVTVQFKLSREITECANDVRDKVGGVVLPKEAEKPVVKKLGATGVVISLFVASKSGDIPALMRLADEQLKPRLQRILGVGEVNIVGMRDREIRIYADPFLLNKYHLTPADLSGIIARENVRAGGGKLVSERTETMLKARGDATTIEELRALQVLPGLRLTDIARVEDGLSDAKSYSSLNGEPGVMLEVKKISGANVMEIIEQVKKVLPELIALAGEGYTLQLLNDQSEKIQINIDNVKHDLLYGAILAVLIVFLFLRNVTATLVSALAIPTSIIGTFAVIDALGYDLNRLTLIGLTLAIGIFIDDAIVVIENISKKLESGLEPFHAAYEGIREIAFSILAISAVLLSVFVPVAFMDGIVGKFFNSFAMTVASGIVISYLVAVMLIPSVGARALRRGESRFYHATEPLFVRLDLAYRALLRPLVRWWYLTLIGVVGILLLSGMLLSKVGGDFVPMEDSSEFQVMVKADVGVSLERMKVRLEPMAKEISEDPLVKYAVLSIGYTTAKETHKARIYVKMLPKEERSEGQEQVVQRFRERYASVEGMKVSVEEVSPFDTGESNAPVQVVLTGPSLEELERLSGGLVEKIKAMPGAVNVDTDFEEGKPEIRITMLRENAKRLGVSSEQIAQVLGSAFSSEQAVTFFEEEGKQFDVSLRFSDEYRQVMEDLKKVQVRTDSGGFVALEGLVHFEETTGASSINRFNRERKILVTSNLFGVPLDALMSGITQALDGVLPVGYHARFTGDIERMAETNAAFGAAVGLAVILIYLILAALYESLIQPFIIMVAMPLSFTGVIVALYLSGHPFSLFVMIGVILLLGMVGKNAILVVDFANRAIKEGKGVEEALLLAGEKRLRPILMTTFAMIFAMIPLAFGGGPGSESNAPMALAIIGGLVSSTILTLLVVPAIYRVLYPLDAWLRKGYERQAI